MYHFGKNCDFSRKNDEKVAKMIQKSHKSVSFWQVTNIYLLREKNSKNRVFFYYNNMVRLLAKMIQNELPK